MRRLMSEKQLNTDKFLATTLDQDIEIVEIFKANRQKINVFLDLAQIRFLAKEQKRLGNASRGSVIRGIINMYMEQEWNRTHRTYNKDRAEAGDLEYWMSKTLAP